MSGTPRFSRKAPWRPLAGLWKSSDVDLLLNRRLLFEACEPRHLLTASVALEGFYSDDDGISWQLDYSITGGTATAFDVEVFRSPDGVSTSGSPIQTFAMAGLTAGTYTAIAATPSFTDVDEDYYLIARLNSSQAAAGFEQQTFEGGSFVVGSVLHIQGTDAADSIDLDKPSTNLELTVNGNTETYSSASITGIRVRSHAGNDSAFLYDASQGMIVFAGAGNDTFYVGGSGSRELHGGLGNDALLAGDRNETPQNGAVVFYGDDGNDTLQGGMGNDTLYGGAGNDSLSGGPHSGFAFRDDRLVGGEGNDTYLLLESGLTLAGTESLVEAVGEGSDTIDLSGIPTGVNLALSTTASQTLSYFIFTLSDSAGFENVIGSAYSDTLAGNELDNSLSGGGGNDVLFGETATHTAAVVGRYLFYNDSSFDGNNSALNYLDDSAIATDKSALLPGQTATFANFSSYDKGINGLLIDIADLPNIPLASDFIFQVGNDDDPDSWSTYAGTTPEILRRAGAGVGSSDRVTLVFPDGAIKNQWLRVTLKATDRTGLAVPDIFYFGNLAGDIGNDTVTPVVGAADVAAVDQNPATDVAITHALDFNRDGDVNSDDRQVAIQGQTASVSLFRLIAPEVNQTTDYLDGGLGSDVLHAGGHRDTLAGGLGNDTYLFSRIAQGAIKIAEPVDVDTDLLDFSAYPDAIHLNLSRTAAQQIAPRLVLEIDAATGFENVDGTEYDDTIIGNARDNLFRGLEGNDRLFGEDDSLDAAVVGRHVFYNNSYFDGNDASANPSDDQAIATNKAALRPGQTATFSNLTSYDKGINGIAIDIANLPGTVTAADFTFKVGSNNSPNSWATAPAPQSILIRRGAGVNYSDRIEIVWADGAIKKTWLQVKVLSSQITGLAQNDVFYFGNLVAETATGAATTADVTSTDLSVISANYASNVSVTSAFDINRDGAVNSADGDLVFPNIGSLTKIAAPTVSSVSHDELVGGDGNDSLVGGGGNNIIIGGVGDDTLIGSKGDDTFVFGSAGVLGSDTILEDAESGTDTIDFSGMIAGVSINLGLTTAQTVWPAEAGPLLKVTLSDGTAIENIIGSEWADTLAGNSLNNLLRGGAGNDTYRFDPNGLTTLGTDTIVESPLQDQDTVDFQAMGSAIAVNLGLTGNQTVNSSQTLVLHLTDAAGIENVIGSAYGDTIIGNAGLNVLTGGAGDDLLRGGAGDDRYVFSGSGNLGTDQITEAANQDHDTLDFSGASFGVGATVTLSSSATQSIFVSTSTYLRLALSNSTAIENVIGSSQADSLVGNSRDNTLTGGAGNDTLEGGTGNDTYVFSGSSHLGHDVLTEASGQGTDTLDFSGLAFTAGAQIRLDSSSEQAVVVSGGSTRLWLALSSDSTFENVIGTSRADSITGNSLNNVLFGGDGNDTLAGGSGADKLYGGAGDDSLDGGSGNDLLSGEAGNDQLSDSSDTNTLIGGLGNDSLTGGTGNDSYVFAGNQSLGSDTITESGGTDTLDFASLAGGVTIDLSVTSAQTVSSLLTLSLVSGTSIENVLGTAFADTLTGNSQNNSLSGGDGDDTYKFVGSAEMGADTVNEVADRDLDTLDFAGLAIASGVAVNLSSSASVVSSSTTYLALTLGVASGLERVLGSNYGDSITGNARPNLLQGNDGNDTISGGDGNDTLTGGVGNDVVYGGNGDDSLIGIDGADYLYGDGGSDTLEGGLGNDALYGGIGDDLYRFAAASGIDLGDDVVSDVSGGSGGDDTLDLSGIETPAGASVNLSTASATVAQSGTTLLSLNLVSANTIETVVGTRFADTISGDTGDNTLIGGAGNDSLSGLEGDDTYVFRGDKVLGTASIIESTSAGSDTLDFSGLQHGVTVDLALASVQVVSAGILAIDLSNDTAVENIIGSGRNDTLTGNSLNNTLRGGWGDDVLTGGIGNDLLAGGADDDTYRLDAAAAGVKTIDEQPGVNSDTLDFSERDAAVTVSLEVTTSQTLGSLVLLLTDDAGLENVVGSAYGDSITGNERANILSGGEGADALVGGTGNDSLTGGAGNDSLSGGSGSDVYRFSGADELGTDIIAEAVDADSDTLDFSGLQAASGIVIDLSNSDPGQEVLMDGTSPLLALSLSDGAGLENVIGTQQDDTIHGNSRDNTLRGGAGDDVLEGADGSDVLQGGAGMDLLAGGGGDDSLVGGSGDDVYQFAGNVALGADLLLERKGEGFDTLDFESVELGTGLVLNLALDGLDQTVISSGTTTLLRLKLDGDAEFEAVLGSAYGDSLGGNDLDNVLIGGDGNDTLTAGAGNDQLSGGDGNDLLTAGSGHDALIGGKGDDSLTGGEGNDIYVFGGSDDLGDDSILESATGGSDTLDFRSLAHSVDVDLEDTGGQTLNTLLQLTLSDGAVIENVIGTDFDDTIVGNDLANELRGGLGDDRLEGDAGADRLEGSLGDDTLYGGSGDDTYVFDGQLRGSDTVEDPSNDSAGDTFDFSGARFPVFIDLGNTATTQPIDALSQSASLRILTGTQVENVIGSVLNDTLIGNATGNTLIGGRGNDVLSGGGGNDVLTGGIGNDTYLLSGDGSHLTIQEDADADTDTLDFTDAAAIVVDLADVAEQPVVTVSGTTQLWLTLSDSEGVENVIGSAYGDSISGNERNNLLIGGGGDDTLYGLAGNDRLEGNAGDDEMYGGAGDDTYVFAGASPLDEDSISEVLTGGTDTLDFSQVDFATGVDIDLSSTGTPQDVLVSGSSVYLALTLSDYLEDVIGTSEDDTIVGNSLANHLVGGDGDDSLTGEAGENSLSGGKGNDVLTSGYDSSELDGGDGNDTLTGGNGGSTFIGGEGDDQLNGGSGNDTYVFKNDSILDEDGIADAGGIDTLNFSAFGNLTQIDLNDSSQQTIKNLFLKLTLPATGYIENLIGGNVGSVTGNAADNVFTVSKGTLSGGDGNDTYKYRNVNDHPGTIIENNGEGFDTIDLSEVPLGIDAQLTVGTVHLASWYLTLTDDKSIESVLGTAYDDTFVGNDANNVFIGGAGNDTLTGGVGNDTLTGGEGDDRYVFGNEGNLGADVVFDEVNEGNDTLDFIAFDGSVSIDIGNNDGVPHTVLASHLTLTIGDGDEIENVLGSAYGNQITGNALDNILSGGAYNDTISGGAGNDTLTGYASADSLTGGDGNDVYRYFGNPQYDLGSDNITEVPSTGGNDTIDFSGLYFGITSGFALGSNSLQTPVSGAPGFGITLNSGSSLENAIGSDGNDTLTGNALANQLIAGAGDDLLQGGDGDDYLVGGVGNDVAYGGSGNDQLSGDGGADYLFGDAGDDSLAGGTGNDVLAGGAGANYSIGGAGVDNLDNEAETSGPNSLPVFLLPPPPVITAYEGQPVSFNVSAYDADGDPLTYLVISGNGSVVSDTFTFSGGYPGPHPIELVVTDSPTPGTDRSRDVALGPVSITVLETPTWPSISFNLGPEYGAPNNIYVEGDSVQDLLIRFKRPDRHLDFPGQVFEVLVTTDGTQLELVKGPGAFDSSSGIYTWDVGSRLDPFTESVTFKAINAYGNSTLKTLYLRSNGSYTVKYPTTGEQETVVGSGSAANVQPASGWYSPVAVDSLSKVKLDLDGTPTDTLITLPAQVSVSGSNVAYTIESQPEHGSLIPMGEGIYIYNPDETYTGYDSFTWSVSNDHGWLTELGTGLPVEFIDPVGSKSNVGTMTIYTAIDANVTIADGPDDCNCDCNDSSANSGSANEADAFELDVDSTTGESSISLNLVGGYSLLMSSAGQIDPVLSLDVTLSDYLAYEPTERPTDFDIAVYVNETLISEATLSDIDSKIYPGKSGLQGLTLDRDHFTAEKENSYRIVLIARNGNRVLMKREYADNLLRTEGDREFGGQAALSGLAKLQIGANSVHVSDDGHSYVAFSPIGEGTYEAIHDAKGRVLTHEVDGTWTLIDKWGQSILFDESGRVSERIDRNGNATTYVYGAHGVESIAAPDRGITTFDYSDDGRVASVTDGQGHVSAIHYDQNGRVVSVTSEVTDGSSAPAAFVTYNSDTGLAESLADSEGNLTSLYYDSSHRLTTVVAPDGGVRHYLAGVTNSLLGTDSFSVRPDADSADPHRLTGYQFGVRNEVTTTISDLRGNTIATVSPSGQILNVLRNEFDQPVRVTMADPDGNDPLESLVTSNEYDLAGNLTSTTYADGTTETWEYDSTWNIVTRHDDQLGHVTLYTLDDWGNVLQETRVVGEVDGVDNDEQDDISTAFTYTPVPSDSDDLPGGLVRTQTDPLGRITRYTYVDEAGAAFGKTQTITQAYGTADAGTITYAYDSDGNLASMTDEMGRVTSYDYDDLGRVVQTTFPDPDGSGPQVSAISSTTYDANGNVLSETDALGHVTRFEYDERGRLVETTEADPDGDGPLVAATTRTIYCDCGSIAATVDAYGQLTRYRYDDEGRLIETIAPHPSGDVSLVGPTTTYTYDALGNRIAVTDPLGNVTQYVYDAMGRQIETILPDPDGPGGPQLSPRTINTYDAAGQLIATTDALGRVTRYEYDELGRQVRTILPDPDGFGTDHASPILTTTYDDAGQVVAQTDARGNVTQFIYDSRGRILQVIQTDPDGDGPLPQPVSKTFYNAAGQVVAVIDPVGRATTYTYDGAGRQTSVTMPDPDGTGPLTSPVMSTTYDVVGNALTQTDPLGNVTSYRYDGLNRLIAITQPDPDGDGNDTAPVVLTIYDFGGRVISSDDGYGRVTTYVYDALGRPTQVVSPDPDGAGTGVAPASMTYVYDSVGNVLEQTNALAETTTYSYDNLYRLVSVEQPNGDLITYTYDAVGNRTSIEDDEDNTTTFEYDALNRLVVETNELAKSRYFDYDANGNRVYAKDRNGRERVFEYDALNRPIAERWLDTTDPETVIYTATMTYDAAGQLVAISDRDESDDVISAYSYGYDRLGRLVTVDNLGTADAPHVTLVSGYDANSNRTSLIAAIDGVQDFRQDFDYDHLNRQTSIRQYGQTGNSVLDKRVDLGYWLGQVDSIARYEDLSGYSAVADTIFNYDNAGRLGSLEHSPIADSGLTYAWGYDRANRIVSYSNSLYSTENTTYGYDEAGQLVSADRTGSSDDESYTYDENGNRIGESYTTEPDNRLATDATYTYAYDEEGNLISRTETGTGNVRIFEYDYRNRLVSVKDYTDYGGGSEALVGDFAYTYDVNNLRIAKSVDSDGEDAGPAVVTNFVYDGQQIALQFGDGTLTHRYLYGSQIDQILADENLTGTPTIYWALADNLGSVRELVAGGELVKHLSYDAFGNVLVDSAPGIEFLFAYTGRDRDLETGLQYNRARYYDPAIGRWISQDPIGFQGDGANLYRYVGNRPTSATDPSGLFTDFAPNGPNPPQVESGAAEKTTLNWGITLLHLAMFAYYGRNPFTAKESDVLFLEGPALLTAQEQSQQIAALAAVKKRLESDAKSLASQLKVGESDTFADRGFRPINSDFTTWSFKLALGQYTAFWRADGWVGPKKLVNQDGDCHTEIDWGAKISWTLYDVYDFDTAGGLLFPPTWLGTPYKVFGYWDDDVSGTIKY